MSKKKPNSKSAVWKKLRQCVHILWRMWKTSHETEENVEKEQNEKSNPYLSQIREILELILQARGRSYGTMRLLVIDEDSAVPEEAGQERSWDIYDGANCSSFGEDAVMSALEELCPDLNYLIIVSNRQDFFTEYAERLYQEQGLLVQFYDKSELGQVEGSVVLDFEKNDSLISNFLKEGILYIPIYKKTWETAGNIDILVPIGYNTMIVKRTEIGT